MTLTIDIAPDLQARLNKEAARSGMDTGVYIARMLEERLRRKRRPTPRLSSRESESLEKINVGLPEETWLRYHELVAKRRAETLSASEQATLIALSDQIEATNVARIEALAQLARLRGVSLAALMADPGIQAPDYV